MNKINENTDASAKQIKDKRGIPKIRGPFSNWMRIADVMSIEATRSP